MLESLQETNWHSSSSRFSCRQALSVARTGILDGSLWVVVCRKSTQVIAA
jgi:hypothetical protein